MKTSFRSELPLLLLVAVPFVYLWTIWNDLPDTVPLHWNVEGEVDRVGSKKELWLIPVVTTLMIYLILLAVPAIDPKRKIQEMGAKYQQLKFALVTFMSGLALVVLYMVKEGGEGSARLIFVLVGLLFAALGNYMKTVKPNYFIGFRTPWTLENNTIWEKTHRMGGMLWFVGGLLMVLISFLMQGRTHFYIFMGITLVISIIPAIYSYLLFRREG
ncbi:SdpI family protein [Robiginitalea sediminis]|uniref:SdpI family protein n=1 Tax=Robiginitalea sediminis TaxID=1982593 RepID=UPI000B4AC01A|nr:SdpI family protein [Robiginitalea sediminis]